MVKSTGGGGRAIKPLIRPTGGVNSPRLEQLNGRLVGAQRLRRLAKRVGSTDIAQAQATNIASLNAQIAAERRRIGG